MTPSQISEFFYVPVGYICPGFQRQSCPCRLGYSLSAPEAYYCAVGEEHPDTKKKVL